MKIESHLNFQYFHNIREMEWAIDLALKYNRPVAATMCIGEAFLKNENTKTNKYKSQD